MSGGKQIFILYICNKKERKKMLYIIYDADGGSNEPVYGIYDSKEKLEKGKKELIEAWVKDVLSQDSKITGIDSSDPMDMKWLRKDIENSLNVQEFNGNINSHIDF